MIFGYFWNCKKWSLAEIFFFVKLIYLILWVFFGLDFFNFSGSKILLTRTFIDKFFLGRFKCGIYFLIWFIQFGNFSFVWKSMMVVSRRSHGFGRHFSVSGGDGPIILPVHNHSRYGTKIRICTTLTCWSTYFTISSRSTICWQRLKLKRKKYYILLLKGCLNFK